MTKVILIVLLILTGFCWLYDGCIHLPKRKRENKTEPGMVSYARGTFLILLIIVLFKVFNVGILLLLVILTFGSLLIYLIDQCIFKKRRERQKKKEPLLVEYARSLFPIFLIVLIVRSFIFEPFVVPTGSLEPTVLPGDFLVVNQFSYGLRLPVINTKILSISKPKTGDIAVFHHPAVPGKDLVKRVIGVPGDHIIYKNRVLFINGKEMKQTFLKEGLDIEAPEYGGNTPANFMEENLNGIKHQILLFKKDGKITDLDFIIPEGYYFMMGDNRDNSADSRIWGLMPESALIGKAEFIFFSWSHGINWSRIGVGL